MHNLHVAITTYERPKKLKRLLLVLNQQEEVRLDVHVHFDSVDVYDDLNSGEIVIHTLNEESDRTHLGKEGYWRLVNQAFRAAQKRSEKWDYVLFVQDDISFEQRDLLKDACDVLEFLQTQITGIASLNLHGDGPDWRRTARWTGRPVVETAFDFVYANWVDMRCTLFTPLAFEAVPVLHPIQREGPERLFTSSGVGRQLSKRFDQAKLSQMMAPEPLVSHADGGISKMNPEESRERIKSDPNIPNAYADY